MLKKISKLSMFEIKYFIVSVIFLPVLGGFIHVWGFKKTKHKIALLYGKNLTARIVNTTDINDARRIGRMVCIAARWSVYRANCLKRALLIWALLTRTGVQSALVIGAKKGNTNDLHAHAWVEVEGEPIGESPNVRDHYSVFE